MATKSEAWSFLEASMFITKGVTSKFIGFATDISLAITYNVLTVNAGRFSSDKKHYVTTKDVEINIGALWFVSNDDPVYTPFELFGANDSYDDANRNDEVTFLFKLINQDEWSDDCIVPDSSDYEVKIEVVGKVAGYDITGNDPDIMISKIRILGQKIKVKYN